RYSTNLQVVIDANSRLVVTVGLPLPGSRNDCRAVTESGVDRACRGAPTIADGGYQGTGLLIPHRKQRRQSHPSPQQEAENAVHRRARARVEHALPRLKNRKILRNCRLKDDGVHQAMLGIARLHNLALTG
ncbi:transposase, partial [Streptomyces sp. NPDC017056]|uniref:transposase n=1 Tax=Streptomyces sp. NPDC017056 TaxID=3364973 RepID=UPI00379B7635